MLGCRGAGAGGDQPGSLLRGSQAPFPGLGSAVVYQPQELLSQLGKAGRAQDGAPHAPLKPGSQLLGPRSGPSNPWHCPFCCSQTLSDSPGGNTLVPWGWDLPGHPSREPTAAPAPPRAQAHGPEQGSSPDLSHPPAAPAGCRAPASRGRKKPAGDGTWGFISFYPSTFEKIIVQVST